MPLRHGLLVYPEARDNVVVPAGETARHRARLDPSSLIPGDAQEVGAPLDGALAQQVDGEAFKESGELAPRLGPGDWELLDPVGRARDTRDLRLDPGRKLTGVQMPSGRRCRS